MHAQEDPPQERWAAELKRIAQVKVELKGDVSRIRAFAVSDGGAPNSLQRSQLFVDMLEGQAKTALISTALSNRLKRGIVTAISWLNPNFRGFSPEQLDLALKHVDLSEHRDVLFSELKKLEASTGPNETLGMMFAHPRS